METEVIAALIAGIVSLLGLIANLWLTQRTLSLQLKAQREEWQTILSSQEKRWQESFRAELLRDLTRESSLETIQERLKCYGSVWEALKVTTGYHVEHAENLDDDIQALAYRLTDFAYSQTGLLMTDRSRRLLNHLRSGCGGFLQGKVDIQEVRNRAHLLKHSMRGDLGIHDFEYESEVESIAQRLGKVDDWDLRLGDKVRDDIPTE